MVLIVAGTLCGLFSALIALVLQFRLPLWERLAGFSALKADYRARVDLQPLRRRLSVIFYAVALGFLGGTISVAIKSLSPKIAMPLFAALILLAFDSMLLAWRRYDKNEREAAQKRGTRLLVALTHVFFVVLILALGY